MANYGMSINEDYVAIKSFSEDKINIFPLFLAKKYNEDTFYISEEAYKNRLSGIAIGVDKIFTLAMKQTNATLDDKSYSAEDLLTIFFSIVLKQFNDIDNLCIVSFDNSTTTLNMINRIFLQLNSFYKRIYISTFSEAISYYLLYQKAQNSFAFMELEDKRIKFYEAQFMKHINQDILIIKNHTIENVFSLDILEEEAGKKIADKILLNYAQKQLSEKEYNNIFLCGKGFEYKDYFKNFMNYICLKHKIKDELYIFAIGASYKAHDKANDEKIIRRYKLFNDARLMTTIYFKAKRDGVDIDYPIAIAGDEWFKKVERVFVLPDNEDDITIYTSSINQKNPRILKFPLITDLMRPNKSMKLRFKFTFSEPSKVDFEIMDKGFGDFYKQRGKNISYEIEI
ncbi:MAG: DUF5716 family protein [Eubacteriales bacterium]|nr:DUF5716 family protein [Eubacteriales bacterium]